MHPINRAYFSGLVACLVFSGACRKLVSIPPPVNTISTSQVFSNDQLATSAMNGIYSKMINAMAPSLFSNGGATIFAGASADELIFYDQTNTFNKQFQDNKLTSANVSILPTFWTSAYSVIYGANSIISSLEQSANVHDSVKSELTGEAEFVRAFAYFYLVNYFQNVPLVLTTDYNKTSLLGNVGPAVIYNQIIFDLTSSVKLLSSDFSVGNGQRIVPTKWAAEALLARVYLYLGRWQSADSASSVVLNSGLFSLSSLQNVFLANSSEAIWQLQQPNDGNSYNATPEGFRIIPKAGATPYVYLTKSLLNAFDSGDNRRFAWIDSVTYRGTKYYLPYKYKTGANNAILNGSCTEYYTVLRAAEQYLIRAEAEVRLGNDAALPDLNAIRNRAGLGNYSGGLSIDSLMGEIQYENQIEFFSEWGHRWFDLKRWNIASDALGEISYKIPWNDQQLLYPIPLSEVKTDPNLNQNNGY